MKYAVRTGTPNIKLLKSVCQNSASAVIICSTSSAIPVIANEAICRMLGYTEAELTQLDLYSLLDAKDGRTVSRLIEELPGSTVTTANLRVGFFTRGGDQVENTVHLSYVCEDDGAEYFIFNIERDEETSDNYRPRVKEETYKTLLNAFNGAALLLDTSRTILMANQVMADRYATTIANLIGKDAAIFFPTELVKSRKENIQKVIETGKKLNFVDEHNGRTLDSTAYPIFDAQGNVVKLAVYSVDITEKRKDQEELHLRSFAIEESFNAMILALLDGTVTYVNKSFLELWRYETASEIIGMSGFDCFEDPDHVRNLARSVEDSGQWEGELTAVRGDGTKAIMHVSGKLLVNERNEPLGLMATCIDITSKRKSELALIDSEKRLSLIFNASQDVQALWRVDKKDRFVCEATNQMFITKMTLLTIGQPAKFIGEEFRYIFKGITLSDETIESYLMHYRVAVVTGRKVQFEGQLDLRGAWAFFEITIEPVLDQEGFCTHLLMASRDTTDRRQAERALRESEERLRLALVASSQGIYDLNMITGVAKVSPEYVSMLGYDHSSFMETYDFWSERLHEDDRARVVREFEDYKSGKIDEYRVEFRQQSISGEWKWILSIGKIVGYTSSGQPSRMIGTHTDITELKRVDRELKESQHVLAAKNKELQEVIDALDQSSLVSMVDKNGVILKANKRFCDVSGYTQDELIGKTHKIINSGYHSEAFWSNLWRTITSGKLWRGEINNKAKDGSEYWVNTVINPIHDEHGEITYYLSIRQDISELKKSQAIISESEERLRHAIGVAQIGIFEYDHLSNVMYWSPEQRNIFGWTYNKEIKFEDYVNHIHPDDLSSTRLALRRAYDPYKDGIFDFTHRIIDQDGNLKWLKVKSKTHFEGYGNDRYAVRTIGATEDITNHKIALQLLEESELKFRSLYELSPVGIVLNDFLTGKHLDFNDALYKHTGYSKEEYYNLTYWDVTPPEYHDQEIEQLRSMRETGYYGPYEKEYFRKDGTRYAVLLNGVKLVDGNGREVIWSVIQDITERKNNEVRLRENEARLSEAQRMANLGYWDYDFAAKTAWYSEEQLSIIQATKSEMPTEAPDFLNLIHPDDRDQFLSNVHELMRSGIETSIVYRLVRPRTGEVRIIQGLAQISRNSQGYPVKLFGVNQDITERLLAERALRESEQNLRKAQQIAKIGSWRLDLAGGALSWSAEAHKIFDRPEGIYLSHKDFLQYVHPEDREFVGKAWSTVIKGEAHDFVHRIIVNDKVKWIREQAELTSDEYNIPLYIFGTIQDITDQKFLQDVYLTFNQSQMLTKLGSWRWTIKTNALFWSDNTFNLFGIDKDTADINYDSVMELIHPEDRSLVKAANENSLKTKEPFDIEYRIPVGDEIKWMHGKGNVLSDDSGEVVEMYGVIRDITNEKHAKEALEQARRASEEASSIKDEFLSVMSHEIRTPLNSVIGLSNLLLRRNPREDQLELVKVLKGSADNLMHLVNDILDFNKIRSGKVELEKIRFDLYDLLHAQHASAKITTQDKGLEFDFSIDPLIPGPIEGDVTRLHQIFTNLLSNAIKFTHSGYVRLTADLVSLVEDQCLLRFKIEDSGVGIARDKLDSVFEPFRQSGLDISRKYGGTGLGLSIVKSLVDLMGGRIMLDSTLGVGTVFTFELPFGFSESETELIETPTARPEYPQASRRKRAKVLYVEDVASNRFLIENILSDNSMDCELAASGRAALRLTALKKFDVILMDIQMPGMDGYQTTERIRSQTSGKNQNTSIIAFTAEPYSSTLKAKTLEYDIQYMISKPFDQDVLIRKIKLYAKPSVSKKQLFTFSFYEEAFNHDARKLRKIKKAVIADVSRFESALLKYEKANVLEKLRTETHRIRPIIKNLGYVDLRADLDELRLYDGPPDGILAILKKTKKHISKLLLRLEKLEY